MINRRRVLTASAGAGLTIFGNFARAQGLTKVRLGGITYTAADAVGPYAALKEGYFREEGIDPVLSTHANGPIVLQKMAAGDVDVAISTAISPILPGCRRRCRSHLDRLGDKGQFRPRRRSFDQIGQGTRWQADWCCRPRYESGRLAVESCAEERRQGAACLWAHQ
jgi:NMT1/THI5 like